ncbi:MAG: hypothetical protein AAF251_09165 [Pseudomonadota bacterium]
MDPVAFRVPAGAAEADQARVEICFDKLKAVSIGQPDRFGEFTLNVTLNKAGALELAQATIPNVGSKAEIVQGNETLVSPIINEPLLGGSFAISGVETIARAEQIRQAMQGRCSVVKDKLND